MPCAILSAITSELEPFLQGLEPAPPHPGFRHQQISFYSGAHAGRPLVAARAGLGKVNAALAAQVLIDRFQADLIVQVGLAGAVDPELDIGDIVLARRLVQHDYDLTQIGLAPGEVLFDLAVNSQGLHIDPTMRIAAFESSPELLRLAESAARGVLRSAPAVTGAARGPRLVVGTVVSGDQFIQSSAKGAWLRQTYGAIATEMEAAAVAQVCHLNRVPFLGIRAISDRADGSAHMDIVAALPVAAAYYHQIVLAILNGAGPE